MKSKNDIRTKRRIGALVILGIFAMSMLAQPAAAAYILMGDDEWIGFTGGAQIIFDSTPTPDDIEMMNASVGIGDKDPDFTLEVNGSQEKGYFGVSSSSDGDIFIIDSNGNVGIGTSSPVSKLSVLGGVTVGTTWASQYSAPVGGMLIEGNIGIGVTNPAEKLEIDGNILFNTGADRSISVEQPSANNNGDKLTISSGDARYIMGTSGYRGGDLILRAGSGAGVMDQYPGSGGNVYIYGGTPNSGACSGGVILAHTGTQAVGAVGIGTASPDSFVEILCQYGPQLQITQTKGTNFATFKVDNTGDLEIHSYGSYGDIHLLPQGNIGIGTYSPDPDTFLEIEEEGTVKNNFDILSVTNEACALDMDGTETSIRFNLWGWNTLGWPAGPDDAGRVTVGAECDWSAWAGSHNSYMAFQTSLEGNVNERVRISSEGRVGIGTTDPEKLLHIGASGGTSGSIRLEASNGEWVDLGITTSDQFYITGGHVGIGTNNPQRSLHVSDVLRLEPRSSAPDPAYEGDIYYSSTYNMLYFYDGGNWRPCYTPS